MCTSSIWSHVDNHPIFHPETFLISLCPLISILPSSLFSFLPPTPLPHKAEKKAEICADIQAMHLPMFSFITQWIGVMTVNNKTITNKRPLQFTDPSHTPLRNPVRLQHGTIVVCPNYVKACKWLYCSNGYIFIYSSCAEPNKRFLMWNVSLDKLFAELSNDQTWSSSQHSPHAVVSPKETPTGTGWAPMQRSLFSWNSRGQSTADCTFSPFKGQMRMNCARCNVNRRKRWVGLIEFSSRSHTKNEKSGNPIFSNNAN